MRRRLEVGQQERYPAERASDSAPLTIWPLQHNINVSRTVISGTGSGRGGGWAMVRQRKYIIAESRNGICARSGQPALGVGAGGGPEMRYRMPPKGKARRQGNEE